MTTEELEQIGNIIATKLEAEREHTKQVTEASEKRIKAELTAAIKTATEGLADDMGEFFHKTWEKMDETNERVTTIENHVELADPHKN